MTYAHRDDDSSTVGGLIRADSGGSVGAYAIPTFGAMTLADIVGSGEKTGLAVGMDYSFSKATTLNLSYGTYDRKAANRITALSSTFTGLTKNTPTGISDEYRIRFMKTF